MHAASYLLGSISMVHVTAPGYLLFIGAASWRKQDLAAINDNIPAKNSKISRHADEKSV